MGHQLFECLAEFQLLHTGVQEECLEPLFQYGLGAVTCKNAAGARLTQGPGCDLIQVIEE
jgi:hypothetical protein